MAHSSAVAIPQRMQYLSRDPRGLPVPFIALVDKQGKPHFTINDERKRMLCAKEGLCALCGSMLYRGHWFVGGPRSAFEANGAYIDGPMHPDCMHYALKVCPYLAAPHYGKLPTDAAIKRVDLGGVGAVMVDPTMLPDRPKVFVAVMAIGHKIKRGGLNFVYLPNRPYRQVEYWLHGQQLSTDEGSHIVAAAMREAIAETSPDFYAKVV